jgi:hypothetical protein
MAAANGVDFIDGYNTSPLAGVSTRYLYGSNVYASIWSGDAWCGGYFYTVGLKATQIYGWGSSSAATDGFIGTDSSTYVGMNSMPSNQTGGDSRLNHNQSRRSCHGIDSTIASAVYNAPGGYFSSPPADYTISPSAQACGTTDGTWWSGSPTYRQAGCNASTGYSSWASGYFYDCYTAYGFGGPSSNPVAIAPDNYTSTFYYTNFSSQCPDSWLGDGWCDLCLVAKYGYDSASGQAADDDCVPKGPGATNQCSDIAWHSNVAAPNQSTTNGSWGITSYTTTH